MGNKNAVKPAQARKGLDIVHDIQTGSEGAPSFVEAVIHFSGKNILLESEFQTAGLSPKDLAAVRRNQGSVVIADRVQTSVIEAARAKLEPMIVADYYKNPHIYSSNEPS